MTPALAALVLAVPGVANAQVSTTGRGENVTPVKNIPFKNLRTGEASNAGTDLEFATITVAGAAAKPNVTVPQPNAKPSNPPKSKAAPKCKKPKKPKKGASKKAKAKYKTALKKYNKCKKARKSALARAAQIDADPAAPGQQRTIAFVGSYADGLQIIDITDPANSELIAVWDCGVSQGDVQVFKREDLDKWFVAYAHDDGYSFQSDSKCAADLARKGVDVGPGYGTFFADVTDPKNPKTVSFLPFEFGSHNVTVHPSGKVLYNSNSDLITNPVAAIEIADISDLSNPKKVSDFPLKIIPGLGTQSHDITFNAEGNRAFIAAVSHGEILDTSDPLAPKFISATVDPAFQVWHQIDQIEINDPVAGERRFMIAQDEFAGATGTGQCPNGGMHVFDITGELEAAPVKLGYWNIQEIGATSNGVGTCTAHVFQVHRDAQFMTVAFYNGGVHVVDISGLVGVGLGSTGVVGPKAAGYYRFEDHDTWAVKSPLASRDGFWMFSNDHTRGFDVFRYQPTGEEKNPQVVSKWYTPSEALERANRLRKAGVKPGLVCMIPAQKQ
jgi:hypothetical protein